ncbi:MAG: hypothetical protein AB7F88_08110 [Pyrinomonadaceae bacterium]
MPETPQDLGRLISSHSTSPAYLQRAAIVAVISFVFFLATLGAFYIRQQIGYFLLSTAFLIVYLFTLIGWVMQKRNVVTLYEKGLKYKSFHAAWHEIAYVNTSPDGLTIKRTERERTLIPRSVSGYEHILLAVKNGIEDRQ